MYCIFGDGSICCTGKLRLCIGSICCTGKLRLCIGQPIGRERGRAEASKYLQLVIDLWSMSIYQMVRL